MPNSLEHSQKQIMLGVRQCHANFGRAAESSVQNSHCYKNNWGHVIVGPLESLFCFVRNITPTSDFL